ncbi:MAG: hypothetical protein ACR2KJ_07205 [Jatrophihabitans sp.]
MTAFPPGTGPPGQYSAMGGRQHPAAHLAAGATAHRRRQSLVRWAVGMVIVVLLVLLLAKSIPAAPRPSLGPPSTPPASTGPKESGPVG